MKKIVGIATRTHLVIGEPASAKFTSGRHGCWLSIREKEKEMGEAKREKAKMLSFYIFACVSRCQLHSFFFWKGMCLPPSLLSPCFTNMHARSLPTASFFPWNNTFALSSPSLSPPNHAGIYTSLCWCPCFSPFPKALVGYS